MCGVETVKALTQSEWQKPVLDVVKMFGAKGDGITKDTSAIQSAFLTLEKAGGGTVLLPSGGTFLSGAFNMTRYVTLCNRNLGFPVSPTLSKQHYPRD